MSNQHEAKKILQENITDQIKRFQQKYDVKVETISIARPLVQEDRDKISIAILARKNG